MEPLVVAGALVGGSALAGAAIWAAWRATRARKPAVEKAVPLTIIEDDAPAAIARPRAAPVPASPSPAPASRAPAPRAPARAVLASPSPHVIPPRGHPSHAPAMVLTPGVELRDDTLAPPPPAPPPRAPPRAAPAPAARPPMRMPPPSKSWAQQVMESTPSEVPTEWARRQVGPVEPGRTAGACGGCGARLSVSTQRPLRIACPVCGRTKLIAA